MAQDTWMRSENRIPKISGLIIISLISKWPKWRIIPHFEDTPTWKDTINLGDILRSGPAIFGKIAVRIAVSRCRNLSEKNPAG